MTKKILIIVKLTKNGLVKNKMHCRFKNKNIKKDASFERGLNQGVDTMLTIFAYVLSKCGYKGKKIQQLVNMVVYTADSIVNGYVTIQDIEETLWDEYKIEMKKRKEWLHRSNQQSEKDV